MVVAVVSSVLRQSKYTYYKMKYSYWSLITVVQKWRIKTKSNLSNVALLLNSYVITAAKLASEHFQCKHTMDQRNHSVTYLITLEGQNQPTATG